MGDLKTKPFDVLVFGATSFVGKILCRYLLEQYGVGGTLKWAAAARSKAKLDALRTNLGQRANQLTMLTADAADAASLRALCAQARVIVSTVGPYALHGQPLVHACVESSTDYCDITGEVQWIRRMIHLYESAARASGARIVHCCGFDSLPSDLGVLFTQNEARKRWGQPCARVKMRVKVRGGYSGGTALSMLNVIEEVANDAALRKALGNPYALCPEGQTKGPRQPDVKGPLYDDDVNSWVAPFVMSAINTRIVHRTNALTGHAYGSSFLYDEAMLCGPGVKGSLRAGAISAAVGAVGVMGSVTPLRKLAERALLTMSGEGPSPQAQESGFFEARFSATSATGERLRTRVRGDRDPGYGSTGKMLGEAAVCLATDVPKDKAGGFWTPATLLGEPLIARLGARAGVTFSVDG
ncbi:MAG: saccharopine dehydrogenase NADP-binding domain-containing protein [Myxococcaceae bacterium]|nr:saccharopine dehydrogenase NADP-binding domain-containing protein [Myxococcaceae bacterium]